MAASEVSWPMTNVAKLPVTESGSLPLEKLVRYCTRGGAGGEGKKTYFRPAFSRGPVAQPASSDQAAATRIKLAWRIDKVLEWSTGCMIASVSWHEVATWRATAIFDGTLSRGRCRCWPCAGTYRKCCHARHGRRRIPACRCRAE